MKKNIFQIVFKLTIVIGIFFYLYQNYSIFLDFKTPNYPDLFLTIFLKTINVFLVAYINFFAFSIFKTKIDFLETFNIHLVSLFGNFFSFAKSGTAYKAFVLKSDYKLDLKNFSLVFIVSQLCSILMINIITLIYISNFYNDDLQHEPFLISILIVIFIILFIKFLSQVKNNNSSLNEIKKLFYLKNLCIMLSVQSIAVCVNILSNFSLSNSLGYGITTIDNLIYTTISISSIFLSITPNALGIKEFLILSFENIMSLDALYLFNFSIADRFTDALMLFFIFLLFKFRGVNLLNKAWKK